MTRLGITADAGYFAPIDNRRFKAEWFTANDRIASNHRAGELIAARYGRDWKCGRRTAVCAASCNSPLWQEAVALVEAAK